MTLFALLSVLVTSGARGLRRGDLGPGPARRQDRQPVVLFALVTVLVATLSVNIAANVVSPAYDFSNLRPSSSTSAPAR